MEGGGGKGIGGGGKAENAFLTGGNYRRFLINVFVTLSMKNIHFTLLCHLYFSLQCKIPRLVSLSFTDSRSLLYKIFIFFPRISSFFFFHFLFSLFFKNFKS